MNKETINFKVENFKVKVKKTAKVAVEKTEEAIKWTVENKEAIIAIATVAIAGTAEIRRCSDRIHANYEANKRKYQIWDPSVNDYIYLRRPLTKAQHREFTNRRANHERVQDILRDMRVI